MKRLLVLTASLAAALGALAQPDDGQVERQRIAHERREADARLLAQEKACYAQFAVNDCLKDARSRRRETMADLRRQEVSLNEADRKRRAAERARALEERASAQRQEQEAQRAARALQEQAGRDERAARKAADAQARKASAPGHAAAPRSAASGAHRLAGEDARNAQRYQEKQQEARERKARVDKRLEESRGNPPRHLPVPP